MSFIKLFFFIILIFVGPSPTLKAANLQDFVNKAENLPLPLAQYEIMRARRLNNAKVIWVNYDYFNDLGITVPDPMTEDFKNKLIFIFGWGIQSPHDQHDDFTLGTQSVYIDYYGGNGRGLNVGSGRAASFGSKFAFQSKGLGRTVMTSLAEHKDHSNGLLPLGEAIREAIFGELNHRNLSTRSNRILLILDRGTESEHFYRDGARKIQDAIIIREDPIRPAHFMLEIPDEVSLNRYHKHKNEYLKYLAQNLPVPDSHKEESLKNQIHWGLIQYIQNLAVTYAESYFFAKLYHAGTSQSNINLNGGYVDYGTQTGLIGFGKMNGVNYTDPAGDVDIIKETLIEEFINELKINLGPLQLLPMSTYKNLFDKTYERQSIIALLRLVGFPKAIAWDISQTSTAQKLGNDLKVLALRGVKNYLGDDLKNVIPTRYNFEDIARMLFKYRKASVNFNQGLLADFITTEIDLNDRHIFKRALLNYRTLYKTLEKSWPKALIDKGQSIESVFRHNIFESNKSLPEIFRSEIINDDLDLVDSYAQTKNPDEIVKRINSRIKAGTRATKGDSVRIQNHTAPINTCVFYL